MPVLARTDKITRSMLGASTHPSFAAYVEREHPTVAEAARAHPGGLLQALHRRLPKSLLEACAIEAPSYVLYYLDFYALHPNVRRLVTARYRWLQKHLD